MPVPGIGDSGRRRFLAVELSRPLLEELGFLCSVMVYVNWYLSDRHSGSTNVLTCSYFVSWFEKLRSLRPNKLGWMLAQIPQNLVTGAHSSLKPHVTRPWADRKSHIYSHLLFNNLDLSTELCFVTLIPANSMALAGPCPFPALELRPMFWLCSQRQVS